MASFFFPSFLIFPNFFSSGNMGEMAGFQLGVIGALFLSVASSVSIVICNKALMSNLGFPFGILIYLNFLTKCRWKDYMMNMFVVLIIKEWEIKTLQHCFRIDFKSIDTYRNHINRYLIYVVLLSI